MCNKKTFSTRITNYQLPLHYSAGGEKCSCISPQYNNANQRQHYKLTRSVTNYISSQHSFVQPAVKCFLTTEHTPVCDSISQVIIKKQVHNRDSSLNRVSYYH